MNRPREGENERKNEKRRLLNAQTTTTTTMAELTNSIVNDSGRGWKETTDVLFDMFERETKQESSLVIE